MGRLKDELLVVIATSSSETAIPGMMQKLQASGVSRTTLGLVIPTGYSFNLDGVAITLPMSCLFIAQVYGIHLDLRQQITMFILMLFTSKGAAGVTGGAFAALAATVVASGLPAEGLALLLGIDRFMSQGRSIVNTVGNAVAAVVVAKWDGEFDPVAWKRYRTNLDAGSPAQSRSGAEELAERDAYGCRLAFESVGFAAAKRDTSGFQLLKKDGTVRSTKDGKSIIPQCQRSPPAHCAADGRLHRHRPGVGRQGTRMASA